MRAALRPQLRQHGGQGLGQCADVVLRRLIGERDADGAVDPCGVNAHGLSIWLRWPLLQAEPAETEYRASLQGVDESLRADTRHGKIQNVRSFLRAEQLYAVDWTQQLLRLCQHSGAAAMDSVRFGRAARQAAARPQWRAGPSLPLRRPLSCPPPSTNGGSDRPGRMYSAPAPMMPWTLWAETEMRSARACARNGT